MPVPIDTLAKYHPDDALLQTLTAYQGRRLTWGLLKEFIKQMGFDQDEYFDKPKFTPDTHEDLIWSKAVAHIAVYWVEGSSEGYYVHVDRILYDAANSVTRRDLMMLGKFWDWDRAEQAAIAVQRFVNLLFW